jgi:polysaccharide biosynthesis protein PslH
MAADSAQLSRRLLFLLPFAPRLDAAHGGGRATAQLLVSMAARHQIALLYLRAADEPPIDTSVSGRCVLVEEVHRPGPAGLMRYPRTQRLSMLVALLRGVPLWAADWATAEYARRASAMAQMWRPDIVQIEFQIMAQYLPALDRCHAPRVLTVHDPGAALARELWSAGQTRGRLFHYLNMRAWARFERRIIRQLQAVVVFTERDRRALARVAGRTPVVRIPLGTMVPARPLDPLGATPPRLLFVGNFVHPPNIDAATYLVGKIFPLVQARLPGLLLYIVGDQPPPQLRQMASQQVVVTGYVRDVGLYLNDAALVIVPLRLGGGMRVKVLEALSAGKAVVASPLAVEGLDLIDGEQIVLACSEEQFANAIEQLLTDPKRRAALASRARAWACTQLGWQASIEGYEALYRRLIEQAA